MSLRRSVRGIGWVEFSVVLFLLTILMGFFVSALLRTEQAVERGIFNLTASELRTELMLKRVELMMSNRVAEIGNLLGSNPVLLLHRPLLGYVGETDTGLEFDGGNWYFDRKQQVLIYRFRQSLLEGLAKKEKTEGRISIRAPQTASKNFEGIELLVEIKK